MAELISLGAGHCTAHHPRSRRSLLAPERWQQLRRGEPEEFVLPFGSYGRGRGGDRDGNAGGRKIPESGGVDLAVLSAVVDVTAAEQLLDSVGSLFCSARAGQHDLNDPVDDPGRKTRLRRSCRAASHRTVAEAEPAAVPWTGDNSVRYFAL